MKKQFLSFLLALLFVAPFAVEAQTQLTSQTSFATVLNDLKTRVGTTGVQVLVSGLSTVNDNNGGTYMWDATSTTADNGFTVIQVTGVTTGRWLRVGNSNTVKSQSTVSGAALQTAYTINHGLPFTPVQVYIQPRSANAAVPSWVSNINATSFTVNFASVPVLGTNNLVFDWLVIKQ